MATNSESTRKDKAKRYLGGKLSAKVGNRATGLDVLDAEIILTVACQGTTPSTDPDPNQPAQLIVIESGSSLIGTDSGMIRFDIVVDGYSYMYPVNGVPNDNDRGVTIIPDGISNADLLVGYSYLLLGMVGSAWDYIASYGNLVPGTHNTYDLGTSSNRWQDAYFVDVYYSGALNNSHQVENNKLLPITKKYRQGTVLCMTKKGVRASSENNSGTVVGVFESKQKSVCTFGVYKVLVSGKVKKGNRLISAKNGRARKARFWERNSFAIALENGNNSKILSFIKP